MTANAGELINLAKEKLPVSSISVFVTGFIKEQVKIENNLFKYFKITVSEFIGGNNNLGKNFVIKCRYLILDERIDKKLKSTRKNSCLMIVGELVFVDSEFLIDIQDINFLSTSNANIETLTNDSTSSSYTWTTDMPTGRVSAQAISSNRLSENLINIQESNSNNDDLTENSQESNIDEEDLADTSVTPPVTQPRGRSKRKRK